MLHLTPLHVVGLLATIALIIGIGVYSGRHVKSADDFSSGGSRAGAWIVAGAIMGTLVSGQATIGTAQLAFSYGMSAWWFTLGSGIGCLILAIGFVAPLRRSGCSTLLQVVSREYGPRAESLGSIFCSIGIFISVVAQILSATALLSTIFPLNHLTAALISIVLMAFYVIFGGVWGAGMGGVAKLILLYVSSIVGGILVYGLANGFGGLMETLQSLLANTPLGGVNDLADAGTVSQHFTSLVARGPSKDIGSGLSLVLGVLATQTYAQAIWSGKSDSAARKGALLSALLIPPIGVACILIGLYMRGHCITADEVSALQAMGQSIPAGLIQIESSAQVFPVFVVDFMPKLLGGVVLGTLFITVVGGGSGLALGMSSILVTDIFARKNPRMKDSHTNLIVTRGTIMVILVLAVVVAILVPGAMINDLGFLSMGLRGAVVFFPMCGGLWFKGKIAGRYALAAIIAGPVAVLAGSLLSLPFDPLFLGMAVCFVVMAVGFLAGKKNRDTLSLS
ncbi:MAG: sodium:solute symporter family protein [Evtepia sp.]|uniref:sodium:solute symporter family protein n=1 Tax=Evtepia sp. TaxID=2773933 RepID=UPI002A755CA1|nr:sodium:solute symporter family protein [Evtepia sp.]MDY3014109.1 sodium:solute symporter family protein [Evtepia sp.]